MAMGSGGKAQQFLNEKVQFLSRDWQNQAGLRLRGKKAVHGLRDKCKVTGTGHVFSQTWEYLGEKFQSQWLQNSVPRTLFFRLTAFHLIYISSLVPSGTGFGSCNTLRPLPS